MFVRLLRSAPIAVAVCWEGWGGGVGAGCPNLAFFLLLLLAAAHRAGCAGKSSELGQLGYPNPHLLSPKLL